MKKLLPIKGLLLCVLTFCTHTLFAQPANNTCAAAVALTPTTSCGATTGQTLYQATATGSPANSLGTTYDVWYRFTMPAARNTVDIVVSPTPSNGSYLNGNNTFIEIFNASACAGVTAGNSLGTASMGTDLTAFNLTPSNTYYFRVFSTTNPSNSSGVYGFSVCVLYNGVPGNDACSGALSLTPGITYTGSVGNATTSAGIVVGCATGTPDDDVWYKFNATRTYATVTVNSRSVLNQSGTMLQAFSGTCGSLTSLACGLDAVNLTGLTIGQEYFVRVYSAGAGAVLIGPASTSGTSFNISVSPGTTATVGSSRRMKEIYQQTNLSAESMVSDPWEVTYGPDDFLWITEAKGYKVFRMDPVTGARTTVLDISRNSSFLLPGDTSFNMRYDIGVNNPQGGLAGLALHPDWTNKKYVYVSYVHQYEGSLPGSAGVFYKNRIVRFEYNTSTGKLDNPISLCDTLPGSGDHNSQRMIIAPVSGTPYLFYAAGDMGAGQFGNATRPIKSQFTGAYEGKILRFNLESDLEVDPFDRWIPNDNPYNTSMPAKQNAVWCTGIRNNQGFAYANGNLYGSSHGPYSDDEINILKRDRNYGHPLVIGYFADNNYNGSKAGHNNGADVTSMPLIVNETTNKNNIANYEDPMFSAYAANQATINGIWNDPNGNGGNGNWPSEGWSGLDVYTHTLVPGWKNSLIAASLKWGRLVRVKMNTAGDAVIPTAGHDTVSYFGGQNRFRDIAVAPNGKDLYVVMDRSTTSSGPSNGNPVVPACPGCIQKYTFLGYADSSNYSTIPIAIPVTNGATNNCRPGTTITIDASNNNLWVPITGPDGNIVAEINANGQNLGLVQSSFYTTASVRNTGGRRFLGRNIYIDPANDPASNVNIRLYITRAEVDALVAAGGAVDSSSLRFLRNADVCRSYPQSAATVITPLKVERHGIDAFVLQASMPLDAANSFYFANNNFVLPLDLITFTGSLQENGTALLKWATENEINTDFFTVERSVDAVSFKGIGNVTAAGNATSRQDYSLIDAGLTNISAKVVYYRLKQVDRNGAVRYSNTVALNLSDVNLIVSVTPNPVNNIAKLRIKPAVDGNVKWRLFDGNGRSIQSGQLTVVKSTPSVVNIPMQQLAQGNYFLQVSGAGINSKIKVQKL